MNEIAPLNLFAYSVIETSSCGIGTEKRVPATAYSVPAVTYGDEWLPPELGTCTISTVDIVARSMRAIRGVLFALMNNQRPSCSLSVTDSDGWCESSHGTAPHVVCNIAFVSAL